MKQLILTVALLSLVVAEMPAALEVPYDPADATKLFQEAINSGAKQLLVRKMAGPWIVDKLELAGDQEIIFESGVVVLARADAFHGKGDALFTASSRKNLRLIGPGATLQMRRADYAGPAYTKSEWRHLLSLRSCTNVVVEGLALVESGGDGIYLGVDKSGGPNKDIIIRKVGLNRNYRQGISVISAENLLIEDCLLRATAGTPPAAGIDFEPNRPSERLVNCVMRRCLAENNHGLAYDFYLGQLDQTSAPISIRLEECVSRGTNRLSVAFSTRSKNAADVVPGRVEFVNCRFEDSGRAGITISKPAAGPLLRFEHCTLVDPEKSSATNAPIQFASTHGGKIPAGGVEFMDCTLAVDAARPLIDYHNSAGVPLAGISGKLIRENGGQRISRTMDAAWLAELAPPDPFFDLPPPDLNLAALPVAASGAPDKIPPHRVRGKGSYALNVQAHVTARCVVQHRSVGRPQKDKPMSVEIFSPSGKKLRGVKVEPDSAQTIEFESPESGLARLVCDANPGSFTIAAAGNPVFLLPEDGTFHFVSMASDYYFAVSSGSPAFGVKVTGDGTLELVKATLTSPSGKVIWQADAIAKPHSHVVKRGAPEYAGVWKLRLERPTHGTFEDHFLELRGVPPVLALQPDALSTVDK
ncbi:MAG: right-handed parallel beta-helix repeat-containing protein [Verrucomicrobiota bacterium]